ncbi:hypothetical protein BJI67_07295 [Acidihalobacter aeolianus]|uniref:DUF502 domain-containing protein n=1 Tax=Acidihalobacter aeolianus TaxID=2792603 RepID=A0A1D8K7H0_9GAMM|nr:DUF502 domain-containing protein [Acidihalobacter aeolianus]AOV16892.1 hypothetical protein BJI67_07295 [Acidihalobacter aeolianus]
MPETTTKELPQRIQRYLLAGVITMVPLWITWLVFDFIFFQLSNFGMPWVRALVDTLGQSSPGSQPWVYPWVQSLLAIALTLAALYLLGWVSTLIVGRKLLGLIDRLMDHIPMAHAVYGSTKKLLTALQQKPDNVQRVVLINFPSPEMRSVGLVTRTLVDSATGKKLAAVYVPTTPNPTSGYLEIVPVEDLVPTDWTMDEAMSFIISGGAVAPGSIRFSSAAPVGEEADQQTSGTR